MFAVGPSKFEKEQQVLRENAKRRREMEQKKLFDQQKREQELREVAAQKKAERELAEEALRAEIERENALTGGIKFNHMLIPYKIEGEDDKIILPERCLTDLTEQDTFGRGPATFRLSDSVSQRQTHCGVREFTAPEGSIGLPTKVLESLNISLDPSEQARTIHIKYVKLSKCTFVKLQPKLNRFFDVGPVKMCLEENLRFHSTLTVGDQVTVWYRGAAHPLIVVDLKPEPQGNLFDTDVEVDLEFSEEFLQHQKESAISSSGSSSSSGNSTTHSSSSAATVAPPVSSSMTSFTTGTARFLNESTRASPSISAAAGASHAINYQELLSEEPALTQSGVVKFKIKLPSGATLMRRFDLTSSVSQLLYFIAVQLGFTDSSQLSRIQVVSKVPSITLRMSAEEATKAGTFAEAGFTESNILVMTSLVD